MLNLITDRAQADVSRVKALTAKVKAGTATAAELVEFLAPMKGAYTYADMNRVESTVVYLDGLLLALPEELRAYAASRLVAFESIFDVPYDPADYSGLVTKTDWVKSDEPDEVDLARYLDNVVLLREALEYATDQLPDSMVDLNYVGANAIEKALEGLDKAIAAYEAEKKKLMDNTAVAFIYSGTITSGLMGGFTV